ncbi:MAG: transcriptional regulator [Burkholderiales bacterium RIFCSPLOWO2_02_FULL_57_36]|nr:MAG: transcriptional regulator [Burkholderiales bacterium RIFCSPLOWO2_02_FULL_57_36]
MALPKPGTPARGSRSGRPIMALLDLLGRRWVLRIIWELRDTPLTFRELRDRCDAMSPTVLNQRLRELRDADIVMLAESGGYALSEPGKQLLTALMPLQSWADGWKRNMADKEADTSISTRPAR